MFKQVAVASAIAFAAFSSQAAVTAPGGSLGTLSPTPELFGGITFGPSHSFSDGYSFTLDGLSNVSGSIAAFIGSVSFSSVQLGTTASALVASNTGYSFSFANLAAGNYTLTVNGTSAPNFSIYTGSVMAQPVPEPESIAMLLAGLGVVGAAVARRRKQAH